MEGAQCAFRPEQLADKPEQAGRAGALQNQHGGFAFPVLAPVVPVARETAGMRRVEAHLQSVPILPRVDRVRHVLRHGHLVRVFQSALDKPTIRPPGDGDVVLTEDIFREPREHPEIDAAVDARVDLGIFRWTIPLTHPFPLPSAQRGRPHARPPQRRPVDFFEAHVRKKSFAGRHLPCVLPSSERLGRQSQQRGAELFCPRQSAIAKS